MTQSVLLRKVGEWLRRYLPAELIATVTAIVGAILGHNLSGSFAVAAIAGTIGENIGYYGYFAIKETTRHYRAHSQHSPFRRLILTAVKTMRDMIVEFGPAEFLDCFIFRPLFMYLGPQIVPVFALGILAGKIAGDIIFYAIAIAGYEFRKRWA